MSVDREKGTWYNHETGEGGGVLPLIERERKCGTAQAFDWLEDEGLKEPRPAPERRASAPIFYDYQDEAGRLAYRVERRGKGAAPPFLQYGPDGKGGFHAAKGCMAGVNRLPYRLPTLMASDRSDPVFVVEGEKDADRLCASGLVATTNSGGAGKFGAELAPYFAGRRVAIIPDNDPPGRAHAEDVAAKLAGVAAQVAVLNLPGPLKSDVSDWLAAGGSAFDLRQQAEVALAAADAPTSIFSIIDLGGWIGRDPPVREWVVQDWIPSHQTTLLTGSGGVGKSLLAQQMATCVALGLPFMGVPTQRRPSLYLTTEDDSDELWRRQSAICASLGVSLQMLVGQLHLSSIMGADQIAFARFDIDGRMTTSTLWGAIGSEAERRHIGFLAFDNASDVMSGDHNDLSQVAAFVNLQTGLALKQDGAVLLLHHPNKAGDDWLGSVAWHNKVRSRMILKRDDNDPDARVLSNPKANYAASGSELAFRWVSGAFMSDADIPPNRLAQLAETSRGTAENAAFLECLRERERQGEGRGVGPSPGPNYAPKQFEGMTQARGLKADALKRAMDRLFAIGSIETFTYRNKSKCRDVTTIRETSPNPPPNPSRTLSPNHPELEPRTTPHTHYPLKGEGAAPQAAAPSPDQAERDLRRTMFPAGRAILAPEDLADDGRGGLGDLG
jgi:RecA-family ATPase